MDRRGFLRGVSYFTVASAGVELAGCGQIGDGEPGRYRFTHGVASGDPRANSLVFWTRCLVSEVSGNATANAGPIDLALQLSTSPGFENTVAGALVMASAQHDHTVRVKINALLPDTRYWYRFIAGGDFSPVGQARTAPAAGAQRAEVKFAWMTCQHWGSNHWGAMELMAGEDLDFIVHLGDYIYEVVDDSPPAGRNERSHQPISLPDGGALPPSRARYASSLEDYRTLYRTYRSDSRLQALHARFPMIAVWDDHEFSDDCYGSNTTYRNDNEAQLARRRAATQAWVEYMPVDFGDLSFDLGTPGHENVRLYRDFQFGGLLDLLMTDERLYRDDHAVSESSLAEQTGADPVAGNSALGSRYYVPLQRLEQREAEVISATGRAPSILGERQTQWWKERMASSQSAWRVWGNTLTLNRMWLKLDQPPTDAQQDVVYAIDCDCWDGFPAHRRDLMAWLRDQSVKNVVSISGDLHAFQCGVIRDDPGSAAGTPVMLDIMTAGISSGSFYSYQRGNAVGDLAAMAPMVSNARAFDEGLRANNPDLVYADHDAQGYATATVSAARMTVTFHKVAPLNLDGSRPTQAVSKRVLITVHSGSLQPEISEIG